jgi:hypothetical protein
MTHGKLKCIGTAQHLKRKYGAGYNISMVSYPQKEDLIEKFVSEHMPCANLINVSSGSFIYNVKGSDIAQIAPFLQKIEAITDSLQDKAAQHDLSDEQIAEYSSAIRDWGISHTTLEDVYLRVTNEDSFDDFAKNNLTHSTKGVIAKEDAIAKEGVIAKKDIVMQLKEQEHQEEGDVELNDMPLNESNEREISVELKEQQQQQQQQQQIVNGAKEQTSVESMEESADLKEQ